MHLFHIFSHSSKQEENADAGMSFISSVAAASISSIVPKWCARSGRFSLLNSQKSSGAKFGDYDGCGTIWVPVVVKNSKWWPLGSAHYRCAKTSCCFPPNPAAFAGWRNATTALRLDSSVCSPFVHSKEIPCEPTHGNQRIRQNRIDLRPALARLLGLRLVLFVHIFLRHIFFHEGFL